MPQAYLHGVQSTPHPSRFERYVAIGDSSTEGLDDPDGRGHYRGWADRLAAHIAAAQGEVLYANLAVRGRRTQQILDEQLAPALAMLPDLVTVFSGTNDVIQGGFDANAVRDQVHALQHSIRASGATALTFTLPDLSAVIPFAKRIMPRVEALNRVLREVSAETGTLLVDFAAHPVASDPRLWSDDRLHANALGHERIAAALAHALGLPAGHERWAEALPPCESARIAERIAAELRWTRRHLMPWVWRHARGRSSGDGITAKRAALAPLRANEE